MIAFSLGLGLQNLFPLIPQENKKSRSGIRNDELLARSINQGECHELNFKCG